MKVAQKFRLQVLLRLLLLLFRIGEVAKPPRLKLPESLPVPGQLLTPQTCNTMFHTLRSEGGNHMFFAGDAERLLHSLQMRNFFVQTAQQRRIFEFIKCFSEEPEQCQGLRLILSDSLGQKEEELPWNMCNLPPFPTSRCLYHSYRGLTATAILKAA